jgi:hypothetical protein
MVLPHLLQHPRALHLDGHLTTAVLWAQLCPVHLTQASSSNRPGADVREHLISRTPKGSCHGLQQHTCVAQTQPQ